LYICFVVASQDGRQVVLQYRQIQLTLIYIILCSTLMYVTSSNYISICCSHAKLLLATFFRYFWISQYQKYVKNFNGAGVIMKFQHTLS